MALLTGKGGVVFAHVCIAEGQKLILIYLLCLFVTGSPVAEDGPEFPI